MDDRGLTTQQVMERLNVKDPDTVYAAYKAGQIRGSKIGGQYRFSERSVEQLLAGGVQVEARGSASKPRRSASTEKPAAWRQGVERILKR